MQRLSLVWLASDYQEVGHSGRALWAPFCYRHPTVQDGNASGVESPERRTIEWPWRSGCGFLAFSSE